MSKRVERRRRAVSSAMHRNELVRRPRERKKISLTWMNMLRSPVLERVMAESSFLRFAPRMALLASLMPPLMGCRLAAEGNGLLVDVDALLLVLVVLALAELLLSGSGEVMDGRAR